MDDPSGRYGNEVNQSPKKKPKKQTKKNKYNSTYKRYAVVKVTEMEGRMVVVRSWRGGEFLFLVWRGSVLPSEEFRRWVVVTSAQ